MQTAYDLAQVRAREREIVVDEGVGLALPLSSTEERYGGLAP